jgi:hypothetical protein
MQVLTGSSLHRADATFIPVNEYIITWVTNKRSWPTAHLLPGTLKKRSLAERQPVAEAVYIGAETIEV